MPQKHLYLGQLYFQQRKYNEAKIALIKAKILGAENSYYELGFIYFKEENYVQAIAICRAAANKENAKCAYIVGLSYSNLNKNQKAIQYLTIAYKNGNHTAYSAIAKIYEEDQDLEKAIAYYKVAAENRDIDAIMWCAKFHHRRNEINLATKYYIKALGENRSDPAYQLGEIYRKSDRIDMAKTYFKIASDLGCSSSSHNLAILHLKEDNLKKTLKYLHRVCELNPTSEAKITLGRVLEANNKLEQALIWFKKAGSQKDIDRIQEYSESNVPQMPKDKTPIEIFYYDGQDDKYEKREPSKAEQKRYARAEKNSSSSEVESNSSEEVIIPKTWQDVALEIVPKLKKHLKENATDIQELITYLANGEFNRRDFEFLTGNLSHLYSMRIAKGPRFVFEILERDDDLVTKIRIYSIDDHYKSNKYYLNKKVFDSFEFNK